MTTSLLTSRRRPRSALTVTEIDGNVIRAALFRRHQEMVSLSARPLYTTRGAAANGMVGIVPIVSSRFESARLRQGVSSVILHPHIKKTKIYQKKNLDNNLKKASTGYPENATLSALAYMVQYT